MAEKTKPTLWEKTKEIAATYTGTFVVVMILNQLLFFGFCLNPICIIAAMPHVLFITVVVGSLINKIGSWGNRGLVKSTKRSFDKKMTQLGESYVEVTREEFISKNRADNDLASKKTEMIGLAVNHDFREVRKIYVNGIAVGTFRSNAATKEHSYVASNPVDKIREGDQSVFITKSNLSKLVYSVGNKEIPTSHFIDLYKTELDSILSHKEMSLLHIYKEMCEDPALAFQTYEKITPRVNSHMVYQGGIPSYHSNEGCEALQRNYFNIEIPPEIEHRGHNEIKRFREFCIENRYMIENQDSRVYTKLEAQFFLKNGLKTVSAGNTGIESYDDLNLAELESKIDDLLIDAESFRNQDNYTYKLINDKGYGTHVVNEAKEPGHPLYIWHNEYKNQLKDLLKTYFRVKFNSDLKFEGHLLSQLGFKPCLQCFDANRRRFIDEEREAVAKTKAIEV